MRTPRGTDWYRRPEIILSELLKSAARGEIGPTIPNVLRATVLAVDVDGGLLENPTGSGEISVTGPDGKSRSYPATVGPENPRGSIKARVLTDGLDRFHADEATRIFWPLLPYDQLAVPVSVGEHVYVMFEGNGLSHGLWMSRVPGQDSANNFVGSTSYTAPSSPPSAMDSFEGPPITPPVDDERASLAPPSDATSHFD